MTLSTGTSSIVFVTGDREMGANDAASMTAGQGILPNAAQFCGCSEIFVWRRTYFGGKVFYKGPI